MINSFLNILRNVQKNKTGIFEKRGWGPSINDVGNWEGSKIGQNCRRIVLKNCRHGRGGVKNPEKLPTSFMDGPIYYCEKGVGVVVFAKV